MCTENWPAELSLVSLQVGQTLSGKFLSTLTGTWGARWSHVQHVQLLMLVTVCLGAVIICLHTLATSRFPPVHTQELDEKLLARQLQQADPKKAQKLGVVPESSSGEGKHATEGKKARTKLPLQEVVTFLLRSPHIQCLAVMALSQGLSTNLIDLAWKNHLHRLHPSPATYAVRRTSSAHSCHITSAPPDPLL